MMGCPGAVELPMALPVLSGGTCGGLCAVFANLAGRSGDNVYRVLYRHKPAVRDA